MDRAAVGTWSVCVSTLGLCNTEERKELDSCLQVLRAAIVFLQECASVLTWRLMTRRTFSSDRKRKLQIARRSLRKSTPRAMNISFAMGEI